MNDVDANVKRLSFRKLATTSEPYFQPISGERHVSIISTAQTLHFRKRLHSGASNFTLTSPPSRYPFKVRDLQQLGRSFHRTIIHRNSATVPQTSKDLDKAPSINLRRSTKGGYQHPLRHRSPRCPNHHQVFPANYPNCNNR